MLPVSVLLQDELSDSERSQDAVGFVAAAGGGGCSRSLADEAPALWTLDNVAEGDWVEELNEVGPDEVAKSESSTDRSAHEFSTSLCPRSCSGAGVETGVRGGGADCWVDAAAGRGAEPEGAAVREGGGGCAQADSDAVVVVAAAAGGWALGGAPSEEDSEPEP